MALTRLAASFLDHLPRLWERDYVPNTDDIVNCRVQMTGVTETLVNAHGNAFRFIDVSSLMGERRKWIHFFQNVTSILFVVDLSGYDRCLAEDRDVVCDRGSPEAQFFAHKPAVEPNAACSAGVGCNM